MIHQTTKEVANILNYTIRKEIANILNYTL